MKKQTTPIILVLSLALLTSVCESEEATLPAGATDLVADLRFEEYKPFKAERIDTTEWKIESGQYDLKYEGDDPNFENYHFDTESTMVALLIENQKLKERVSKLEKRLDKLEGHLTTEKRTSH